MFLLGDSFGNFAIWDKELQVVDSVEKSLPMLVVVNSAFVATKRKVLKNKINCGENQINLNWETAPFCIECRAQPRDILVGLKAINGFSIGKTDVPVRFVTLNLGKIERLYDSIVKAKVSSAEEIIGFDIEGRVVLKLKRFELEYREV